MQKALIVGGILLLAAGLLWPILSKLGLGRLPGDIAIEGQNGGGFYFPIVTCIVVSVVLSAIFWLAGRF